jgi:hypothetical protein
MLSSAQRPPLPWRSHSHGIGQTVEESANLQTGDVPAMAVTGTIEALDLAATVGPSLDRRAEAFLGQCATGQSRGSGVAMRVSDGETEDVAYKESK